MSKRAAACFTDAWVPGNHELDFGSERFLELCKNTRIPILSGNFKFIPKEAFPLPAYKIYYRANKKVAVIGMQSGFLHHWSTGSQFSNCQVFPAKGVLQTTLPKILAKKPDFIILALHQGLTFNDTRGVNEVAEIAKIFPEIDLILGGHTHREIPGYLNRSKVLYVQAGSSSEHLGMIRIKFEHNQKLISSKLLQIDAEIPIDQEAAKLMKPWREKLISYKEKTVANLESALKAGKPGINCRVSAMIGEAILNASEADIALHGRLSNKSFKKGSVSEKELFEIIPYENDLFTVEVSPNQLIIIMQEQMQFQKHYSFNAPYNFTYNSMTQNIMLPKELQKNDKLLLCINSRVAAGGGKRFPKLKKIISTSSANLTELPIKTRDAVRLQLQKPQLPFRKTLLP